MRRTYRNGVGELAPGLVLPSSYQKTLRDGLANIEEANSPANTEGARREAIGIVKGLELARALDPDQIERLYMLIENIASARYLELERDAGL
ncbi:hypothetical protein EGJ51_17975 [Pseudomonas fulva]|uniref:hypothetical protein n=1 Tax=Pseudomonas fulva TaxID=47880 RepID=UPI000F7701B3|nr:hypothetical protein [Pseudomonas fulva]RRW59526.1 hypothetical protein EGJ51_17975 [Pseudomonas fulva]